MDKNSRCISIFLSIVLSVSPLFTSIAHAQATLDIVPPDVLHEPEISNIKAGEPYILTATVTDNTGVAKVTLFYRTTGESTYESTELLFSGSSDTFMVELDASELSPPGLEYYLQAEDIAGNTLLKGFSFDPLVLSIEAGGTPAPTAVASKTEKEGGMLSGMSSKNWLWIGLGVLAVGGLASSGGGGGSGSSDDTVTISAPIPQ